MAKLSENKGFSLAETLIALGILAVGMMFIAGAFPVAIHLTTISVERTTAAVIAEEAFSKIRLYAKGNPASNNDDINMYKLQVSDMINLTDSLDPFPAVKNVGQYEFTYPSNSFDTSQKQYCWSALCRRTGPASENPPVQVTIFVCRKVGQSLRFHKNAGGTSDWPEPCKISVKELANNQLRLDRAGATHTYVSDGCTIVDDNSGQLYYVIRRFPPPDDDIVQLDRDWPDDSTEAWVIPPPIGGGRYPCIAIYQKEIKF